jgi:hypothetical protein
LLRERDAQIVMGVGIARFEDEGAIVLRHGLLPGVVHHSCLVAQRLGIAGYPVQVNVRPGS